MSASLSSMRRAAAGPSRDYIIAKHGSYFNLVNKVEADISKKVAISESVAQWKKNTIKSMEEASIPTKRYEGPSWRKFWFKIKLPGARGR